MPYRTPRPAPPHPGSGTKKIPGARKPRGSVLQIQRTSGRLDSRSLPDFSGRYARGANLDPSTGAVLQNHLCTLEVRQPAPLGLVVCVATVIPGRGTLATNIAETCHRSVLYSRAEIKLRRFLRRESIHPPKSCPSPLGNASRNRPVPGRPAPPSHLRTNPP